MIDRGVLLLLAMVGCTEPSTTTATPPLVFEGGPFDVMPVTYTSLDVRSMTDFDGDGEDELTRQEEFDAEGRRTLLSIDRPGFSDFRAWDWNAQGCLQRRYVSIRRGEAEEGFEDYAYRWDANCTMTGVEKRRWGPSEFWLLTTGVDVVYDPANRLVSQTWEQWSVRLSAYVDHTETFAYDDEGRVIERVLTVEGVVEETELSEWISFENGAPDGRVWHSIEKGPFLTIEHTQFDPWGRRARSERDSPLGTYTQEWTWGDTFDELLTWRSTMNGVVLEEGESEWQDTEEGPVRIDRVQENDQVRTVRTTYLPL